MNWTDLTETFNHLTQPPYLYVACGGLAFACLLLILVRRQPKKIVAYQTESGRVMLSRSAIIDLIRTACGQLDGVTKPRVKIKVKGKTIHFDVQIQLMSGGRLREIEETLQTHLRQNLSENLGIEHLGQINIVATGFKSGSIETSSPITTAEQAPSNPAQELDALETSATATLQEELEKKQL